MPADLAKPLGLKRSALFQYVLFIATGGLSLFYWLYRLMADVNLLYGRRIFFAAPIAVALTFLFILMMLLLAVATHEMQVSGRIEAASLGLFFVSASIVELVMVFLLPVFIFICVDDFEGGHRSAAAVPGIMWGMMVMGAPLPYIQSRMNRALRSSGAGA
jgi:hypothetical protein